MVHRTQRKESKGRVRRQNAAHPPPHKVGRRIGEAQPETPEIAECQGKRKGLCGKVPGVARNGNPAAVDAPLADKRFVPVTEGDGNHGKKGV